MAIDINIGSKLDAKGFKKAETALDKLNAQGKNLAKTFGYAFGTAAIVRYAKNAAVAFAQDEKAAASLSKTIENLGLGFGGASKDVNDYISNLEKQTGVLDDELRPAMDRLLRATSSITDSQKLLSLALDISAGTGKSLTQVSQSLQKAYLGQTQALGRLGVGLSKAELSSGSFEVIQARLTELFAGQAQTAADGYAGSLARLKVASNNAAESIGQDLFTAVGTLAGGDGLPKTIQLIESLSSSIGDAIIGISRLARNISILASGNPLESIRDLQAATRADRIADMKERATYGGVYADIYKTQVASNAAQKKALTTSKALTKETAAQLKAKQLQAAIDKANLALNKGSEIFDMDKIQIAAALTNQAEQLGKATTGSQILQIANDTARLKVKQDILILEDAIASKDQAAIEAATKRLNEDMKILGSLQGQSIKLLDIKSILDTLKPKDLINLDNLNEALRLLGLINLASTGSKTTPSGGGGGGGAGSQPDVPPADTYAGVKAKEAADAVKYFGQSVIDTFQSVEDSGAFNALVKMYAGGAINPFNAGSFRAAEGGSLFSSGAVGSRDINIKIETGIGDPNAIAEAVNQVIQDAVDRGTLRGGAY